MAFKKVIEVNNSGISAEYWKISDIHVSGIVLNVTFELYKDKASRDAGKSSVDIVRIVVPEENSDEILASFYNSIVKTGALEGAVDI